MKSIILSLLVLSALIFSSCQAQKAYGIWDDENGVATAGSIDLNTAKATPLFSQTGYTFNSKTAPKSLTKYNQDTTGISSYNPINGLITYIATEVSSGTKYLVTIDTFTWTIFNNSAISNTMTLGNLAYDLTGDSYNLFATYYTDGESLYVVKLSVSESLYKSIDTIPNVSPNATGTYIGSSKIYGVCYQDNTLTQYCNYYNLTSSKTSSKQYSASGISSPWALTSSPYAMTYLSTQNLVIAYLNINNTSYHPNLYSYQMFWVGSSQFVDTYWATSDVRSIQTTVYTPFCDISLPRVYQFAQTQISSSNPFGFCLYTFSTYNNQWVRTQPTNVGVLNAWSVANSI